MRARTAAGAGGKELETLFGCLAALAADAAEPASEQGSLAGAWVAQMLVPPILRVMRRDRMRVRPLANSPVPPTRLPLCGFSMGRIPSRFRMNERPHREALARAKRQEVWRTLAPAHPYQRCAGVTHGLPGGADTHRR